MATPETSGRRRCVTCGKGNKATLRCGGCLQEYCFNHSLDHRQELKKQLDEIEVARDQFRQTVFRQSADPKRHPFIQEINDWERNSIQTIRRTAEEARQRVLEHTNGHVRQIEVDLNELTDQLRQNRKENDFFETDLDHWNEELQRLAKELAQPSNVDLLHENTSLINKISVVTSGTITVVPYITTDAEWAQNGVTIAGGHQTGIGVHQLNYPRGIYVDDDQTVYVADQSNHRIVEWKIGATSGRIVAGGKGLGSRADQLNYPTDVTIDKKSDSFIICDYNNKRVVRWPRQNGTAGEILISNVVCWGVAMDKHGYLYVSDCSKHEVRRWRIGNASGIVVAGSNGPGNRLDQLSGPTCIYIDQNYAVYVSDENNHRVMKWTKGAREGVVVAGGQGYGNNLTQLFQPRGVAVDQSGTVYVADNGNHRVMRWARGATQGSVVAGGNRGGTQANQLCYPMDLSFDKQNNLYVVNYGSHRVQKFHTQSSATSQ